MMVSRKKLEQVILEEVEKELLEKWSHDPLEYFKSLIRNSFPYNYIQFSDIEKLGIYPASQYHTPTGIYSYPITEEIVAQLLRGSLPFATDRKYIIFFTTKPETNILLTSNSKYESFSKELLTSKFDGLWQKFHFESKTKEEVLEYWSKKATFQSPLGALWNQARMLSGPNSNMWNSIMRHLKIDGVVDDAGLGLIHEQERTQAVFFSASVLELMNIEPNMWNPQKIDKKVPKHKMLMDRAVRGDVGILREPEIVNSTLDPKARMVDSDGYVLVDYWSGNSPLHFLAVKGKMQILKHPLVTQVQDKNSQTPLHTLASNYNLSFDERLGLLRNPMITKIKDTAGRTPLYYLRQSTPKDEWEKLVRYLHGTKI
jgi:hypothetical protein